MPHYRIRQATVSDATVIARHRVGMFHDMGELAPDEAAVVESASRTRLVDQLASGEYVGWLAEADGEVVAGAGVLLHQYYPTSANPRGLPTAYILNVYTEAGHRRRGLAHQLIAGILDWCRGHDIPRASLHSSRFGRSVYERLGFTETNEMRMDTGAAPRDNGPRAKELLMTGELDPEKAAQTTRMVIDRFNGAFNRHDADALALLLTEDTVFEDTSPAPDGRRIEGRAAVVEFWRGWFARNADAVFEAEDVIVTGGRAVVRWVYRKPRNGQPWHLRGVDVFTVRDGKVAAKLAYVKG